MQVKIGPMSLEERSYLFLQSSVVTHELQRVADGGVKFYRKAEKVARDFYDRNFATTEGRKRASAKVRELKWEARRALTRQRSNESDPRGYSAGDDESIRPTTGQADPDENWDQH